MSDMIVNLVDRPLLDYGQLRARNLADVEKFARVALVFGDTPACLAAMKAVAEINPFAAPTFLEVVFDSIREDLGAPHHVGPMLQ